MSTRRYGLMGRGRATRVIAALLVAGMVALFSTTYLLQAGVPAWVAILAVLVVLAVPVVLATAGEREPRPNRGKR